MIQKFVKGFAVAGLATLLSASAAMALPLFAPGPQNATFVDRSILVGAAASGVPGIGADLPGYGANFVRAPGIIRPGDELRSWAALTGLTPPPTPNVAFPSNPGFPFELTTIVYGLIALPESPGFVNIVACSTGAPVAIGGCRIFFGAAPTGAVIEGWGDDGPATPYLRTGVATVTKAPGVVDPAFIASTKSADGTLLFRGTFVPLLKSSLGNDVLFVTTPTDEGRAYVFSGGTFNSTPGAEATNTGVIDVDQTVGVLGPNIAPGPANALGGFRDMTFNAQSFFHDFSQDPFTAADQDPQGDGRVCVGTVQGGGDSFSCTGQATVSSDSLDPLRFLVVANPASLLLLGAGLVGAGLFRRSRKK